MFRDNSRELEFVLISDIWTGSALLLVIIRLPFRMSMAVHVEAGVLVEPPVVFNFFNLYLQLWYTIAMP